MITNKEKMLNELKDFISSEKVKISNSICSKIKKDDQKGLSQVIGRRYGFIWEEIVKIIFKYDDKVVLRGKVFYRDFVEKWVEKNCQEFENECCRANSKRLLLKYISETTATDMQDLCDLTIEFKDKIYAIDTKYRFNSNDSNTVREIANSAIHLKEIGYIPIMLIRKSRECKFNIRVNRFERNGWKIIDDANAIEFIKSITDFDLSEFIKNELNIWEFLKPYQDDLIRLRYGEKDWIY